eukprot:Sdes_comp9709_c0_seq1m1208
MTKIKKREEILKSISNHKKSVLDCWDSKEPQSEKHLESYRKIYKKSIVTMDKLIAVSLLMLVFTIVLELGFPDSVPTKLFLNPPDPLAPCSGLQENTLLTSQGIRKALFSSLCGFYSPSSLSSSEFMEGVFVLNSKQAEFSDLEQNYIPTSVMFFREKSDPQPVVLTFSSSNLSKSHPFSECKKPNLDIISELNFLKLSSVSNLKFPSSPVLIQLASISSRKAVELFSVLENRLDNIIVLEWEACINISSMHHQPIDFSISPDGVIALAVRPVWFSSTLNSIIPAPIFQFASYMLTHFFRLPLGDILLWNHSWGEWRSVHT